jgi:hypothetical protein
MTALAMASKPVIGILSIGEMGMGFGKLLRANDYIVATSAAGRRHADENSTFASWI